MVCRIPSTTGALAARATPRPNPKKQSPVTYFATSRTFAAGATPKKSIPQAAIVVETSVVVPSNPHVSPVANLSIPPQVQTDSRQKRTPRGPIS